MALLAQPKRKQKLGLDPNNTQWANDTTAFGQTLLKKMGWKEGSGLGAKEDGRLIPVKASMKIDNRGLGCTPQSADSWIAHQVEFDQLLASLNSSQGSDSPSPAADCVKNDVKEGERRFHGRFSRGRVQTLRSTEDLDCILGRRKSSIPQITAGGSDDSNSSSNVVSLEPEEENTDKSHGFVTVTSSCSLQDYFAKKMKEKNLALPSLSKVDGDSQGEKNEDEESRKPEAQTGSNSYTTSAFSVQGYFTFKLKEKRTRLLKKDMQDCDSVNSKQDCDPVTIKPEPPNENLVLSDDDSVLINSESSSMCIERSQVLKKGKSKRNKKGDAGHSDKVVEISEENGRSSCVSNAEETLSSRDEKLSSTKEKKKITVDLTADGSGIDEDVNIVMEEKVSFVKCSKSLHMASENTKGKRKRKKRNNEDADKNETEEDVDPAKRRRENTDESSCELKSCGPEKIEEDGKADGVCEDLLADGDEFATKDSPGNKAKTKKKRNKGMGDELSDKNGETIEIEGEEEEKENNTGDKGLNQDQKLLAVSDNEIENKSSCGGSETMSKKAKKKLLTKRKKSLNAELKKLDLKCETELLQLKKLLNRARQKYESQLPSQQQMDNFKMELLRKKLDKIALEQKAANSEDTSDKRVKKVNKKINKLKDSILNGVNRVEEKCPIELKCIEVEVVGKIKYRAEHRISSIEQLARNPKFSGLDVNWQNQKKEVKSTKKTIVSQVKEMRRQTRQDFTSRIDEIRKQVEEVVEHVEKESERMAVCSDTAKSTVFPGAVMVEGYPHM